MTEQATTFSQTGFPHLAIPLLIFLMKRVGVRLSLLSVVVIPPNMPVHMRLLSNLL